MVLLHLILKARDLGYLNYLNWVIEIVFSRDLCDLGEEKLYSTLPCAFSVPQQSVLVQEGFKSEQPS